MATTPRDKLDNALQKFDDLAASGDLSAELHDRVTDLEAAMDPDVATEQYQGSKGKTKTFAVGTRREYLKSLRLCWERGLDLLGADADGVNEFMDDQVDDRGLERSTVSGYQCAVSAFYRFHEDLGVDADEIVTFVADSDGGPDEADMFTESEVEALRDACQKPRNRALLEILIYTGQRITAIRTLQLKHVDTEKGVILLNDEADGLKDATKRGRKRPLFGARRHLRDWKHDYHPNAGDPEAPLFVGDPDHPRTKLGEPLSEDAARKQLRRIAKRAGVEKPVNPHNFRHYFVTVMRREHDVNWETLKALLGAVKHSTIPEDVYSHISMGEHIESAERATGYGENEQTGGAFTPDLCTTCGQQLQDDWNRCPRCGELYAPGLEDVREELGEVRETAVEESIAPDTELSEAERRAITTIVRAVDDPEGLAAKLDGGV